VTRGREWCTVVWGYRTGGGPWYYTPPGTRACDMSEGVGMSPWWWVVSLVLHPMTTYPHTSWDSYPLPRCASPPPPPLDRMLVVTVGLPPVALCVCVLLY